MTSPSPACEVKVGAAAYVPTTSGVDLTVGATIVIRLSSTAGVNAWSIECVTTDDTSDAATVTAALTIDSTLRTATFTAPAAGKAYRFRSRINSGVDVNGVAQSSYFTTFCVYTLTSARRVVAADETTEGDATFGWIKWLNDLIRNPSSSSTTTPPGGASTQVQYHDGASFAGASGLLYDVSTRRVTIGSAMISMATITSAMIGQATLATGCDLVRPMLLAPIIAGTAVFTGTDMAVHGLADHRPISAVRHLTTTDATIVPVYAFKPIDEAVTNVVVEANAIPSGGAAGGSYVRRVMIRMDGGVGTCGTHESSWDSEHTNAGFTGISQGSGIWVGVSGATGFVNVRGTATGNIKWGVTITHQSTSWA